MRLRWPLMVLTAVASLPAITWAAFKPIRVLAPQLAGVTCYEHNVCVDDPARLPEALALRAEGLDFVSERVDRITQLPRFVFCSNQPCAERFGFAYQGAYHIGTSGIVIGPKGWKPFFVRHELIHHVHVLTQQILHRSCR